MNGVGVDERCMFLQFEIPLPFPFPLQFLLFPAVRLVCGWTPSFMVGLAMSLAFDQHSPRPAKTFSVTVDPQFTSRILPSVWENLIPNPKLSPEIN